MVWSDVLVPTPSYCIVVHSEEVLAVLASDVVVCSDAELTNRVHTILLLLMHSPTLHRIRSMLSPSLPYTIGSVVVWYALLSSYPLCYAVGYGGVMKRRTDIASL